MTSVPCGAPASGELARAVVGRRRRAQVQARAAEPHAVTARGPASASSAATSPSGVCGSASTCGLEPGLAQRRARRRARSRRSAGPSSAPRGGEEEAHGRGGRERDVVGGGGRARGRRRRAARRPSRRARARRPRRRARAARRAARRGPRARARSSARAHVDAGERLDQALGHRALGHDVGAGCRARPARARCRARSRRPSRPASARASRPAPAGARTAVRRRSGDVTQTRS